tara:strand:- start:274 stop:573 length:300 start_codon:yes stop_codon:yes gene_type:complete
VVCVLVCINRCIWDLEVLLATSEIDQGVQKVIDLFGVIVGAEGGNLEVISLSAERLTVRYTEGHNEECPECVPSHEMVQQMMEESLKIHAPTVTDLDLL